MNEADFAIVRYATGAELLAAAEPWLLRAEAENNLILGVARRVRHGEPPEPAYWVSVQRGGEIVGAAFRTPPFPLGLTRMPDAAIAPLVDDVRRRYDSLPGVNGPCESAEAFADRWCDACGGRWRPRMRLRVHVLTNVERVADDVPGALRPAQDTELVLLRDWLRAFVEDANAPGGDPADVAADMLRTKRVHFWDHDGPRSMVAAARDTPTGVCVNAVYTPREHRGRGYATAAVAALSRQLLEAGKSFCCLYTDLANPTSNAIYRRIGYEPIRDDVEIVFEA
jgi:predicted GNAT family acetyltransferase